jgi:hypothetical protein
MPVSNKKVKVLYIAGGWRSGSTLFSHVLSQIDGIFSAGEPMFMWEDNIILNRLCGCMTPARECEVWRGVMDEAYGGIDLAHAEEMSRLRRSLTRTRNLPLLLMPGTERLLGPSYRKYLNNLEKVYWAIQASTGCNLIVDASKFPAYGYMLRTIPTIDLYVVHLVRDSRAVAYSRLKKKWNPDANAYMPQLGSARSSLVWDYMNVSIEAVLGRSGERYLMLRYEDFVRSPRMTIERTLKLVHEEALQLPFTAENEVALRPSHMVTGNPGVYKETGNVVLRLDEEWKARMELRDKNLVTLLTSPLMFKYGYLHGMRN